MRALTIFLISAALASAGVKCRNVGNTADNGAGWNVVLGRGNCGAGVTRPVWYVVNATSYAFPPDTTAPGYSALMDAATAAFDNDIQAVFNDARLGDKVLYTASQEFVHGFGGGPRITRRLQTDGTPCPNGATNCGTLEITTTEFAKLPNSGTRVTPAYAPLMATIRTRGSRIGANHAGNTFVVSGGPGSADHLKFRGLRFTVKSDDDSYSYQFNGGVLNAGSASRLHSDYLTSLTVAPVIGQSYLNVLSTDGFAVTTPPQQITVDYADKTTSALYTVTGVNVDGPNTVHVCGVPVAGDTCPAIAQSVLGSKVWSILNREGESNLQPDDVTVQHCLFANPAPKVSVASTMIWSAKATTVRDNWFGLTFDTATTGYEPKHLQSVDAYGPYTIENNYFLGAMAFMHGGGMSSTHGHMVKGGFWRYNAFHQPEELLFVNYWDLIFGPSWKATSEMSVDGLPPNSPRFAMAGKTVWGPPDSNISLKWFWVAYNSGVVGTSKPACLTDPSYTYPLVHNPPLAGEPNTNTATYCYDSDPARDSRGTTYCPPQGTTFATPHLGDGVCWQMTQGANIIKNAWESKDTSNQLLEYNGFISYPPDTGNGVALNTGQYTNLNIKVSSAYYGDTTNWPYIYKQHVNPGVPAANISGCFFDLTAFPNPTTDDDGHVLDAGYSPWPFCARAHGDNIAIRHNYFRNNAGGIQMVGFYTTGLGGRGMSAGPWEVSGNIFAMRDPIEFGHPLINISGNSSDEQSSGAPSQPGVYQVPINGIVVANNTFYTPYNKGAQVTSGAFILGKVNTSVPDLQIFNGTRAWAGNLWASISGGSFYLGGKWQGEADFLGLLPGVTDSSGVSTWGKNIALGAGQGIFQAAKYPTGTIYTGCPGTAKCAGKDPLAIPDFTQILTNPDKGDFRVKYNGGASLPVFNDPLFTAKRGLDSGADVGADPDLVPMIRALTVTSTDRSVIFTYRLTSVITGIPCAVELHTNPDLASPSWAGNPTGYGGELSNIATYFRRDADDYDGYYRDGNRRLILLGTDVNLVPNTAYYYKLHCGGDIALGMFRTLPALSGTVTKTIARTAATTGVNSMQVEFGPYYGRAVDKICNDPLVGASCSLSTVVNANCTKGNRCVVPFTASRGVVYYYRWIERAGVNASGAVLATGKVEVLPAL
jgi:hypothetical protein